MPYEPPKMSFLSHNFAEHVCISLLFVLVLCEWLCRDDEKFREDKNLIVCLFMLLFIDVVMVFICSLVLLGCLFVCSFADSFSVFVCFSYWFFVVGVR